MSGLGMVCGGSAPHVPPLAGVWGVVKNCSYQLVLVFYSPGWLGEGAWDPLKSNSSP